MTWNFAPNLSSRACGPRNFMKVFEVTLLFSLPEPRLSTLVLVCSVAWNLCVEPPSIGSWFLMGRIGLGNFASDETVNR